MEVMEVTAETFLRHQENGLDEYYLDNSFNTLLETISKMHFRLVKLSKNLMPTVRKIQ